MPIPLDWSEPELQPGIRQAEVYSVEEKTSRAGDAMLNVEFKLEGGGVIYDTIMLAGPGRTMGMVKLERLGVVRGTPELPSLIGRKLPLVAVVSEYDGRKSLKVDIKASADPFRLGYGAVKSASPDDTPF